MRALKPQVKIKVPDDVSIRVNGSTVKVSGRKGKISKDLEMQAISIEKENGSITIQADSTRRKHLAFLGMVKAHLNNMIRSVKEGFTYKLRIVYAHFPISVKVKEDRVEIQNFLGERKPRMAKIAGNTNVKVNGDEIIVSGINKEDVGQTAANIEQVTKIGSRDPRTFQDGIYIVERG